MTDNRRVVLKSRPMGKIQAGDLQVEDAPIPTAGEGQVLVKNLYLSIDPGIRNLLGADSGYLPPIPVGAGLSGTILGRAIESHHPGFAEGDLLIGRGSIGEYSVITPDGLCWKVDPKPGAPLSGALGVLGVPGLTAHIGLMEVGRPKPGETVLVSGAAGTVGSLAGQIARLKGCRAVGIAGGEAKRRKLIDEFGFHDAIDYRGRSVDELAAAIAEACPAGVDVLFDNVGGTVLDAALARMNPGGRVAACGMISQYDGSPPPQMKNLFHIISKSLRVEGFLLFNFVQRYPPALAELSAWQDAGQLHYNEEVGEGLDQAIPLFLKLFSGETRGKPIVKL